MGSRLRDCTQCCAPGRCQSAGCAQGALWSWRSKQPRPQREKECFSFSVEICRFAHLLCNAPLSSPSGSRTVLRRVSSLSTACSFFFFLISCVSYLYIVMLMSNSCGADGRGVNGSQSLWISLPITHLAPVAISPRALWWRLPPRRPLRAGAFAFFPGFECHLSVWPTTAPRWPPLARHPSANRVPEPERVPFAPSQPRYPSPQPPPAACAPFLHPAPTPSSEEAAVLSFLNITFTPVGASDEKNSPSRLWVS